MVGKPSKTRRPLLFVLCGFILLITFSSKAVLDSTGLAEGVLGGTSTQTKVPAVIPTSPHNPPPPSQGLALPLDFERHTDDLEAMVKRQEIRALVILNPIGFFYDNGLPKGAMYETLQAFEVFVNKQLKTRAIKIQVTFLPFRIDQIEGALIEGIGDIVAYEVAVTPSREQRVAFSTPIQKDVTQIIVTGPEYAAVSTFEDLSGKEVYVNPLTVYRENLQKINETLQKSGKNPVLIKAADKNLSDDDLIQMVNAGLIPATVTTNIRAELWSKVFDKIKAHSELKIASGVQVAWVMRKDNPRLKQLVDQFAISHGVGTAFGNTVLRRYLKDTQWVKNATSKNEFDKFRALVAIFQKYAAQYDFDYLMLAAQGYQESMLNQAARNPSGAVGIMQVIPKYAASSPINISNVFDEEGNINAGAKMLRNTADTYFNDPQVAPLDRTLFSFASYNAGPNRIAGLRQKAKQKGLDPNVWFDNVELVAAQEIGQQTVLYVGNVYKYYVAYKLALEQSQSGLKPIQRQ